tara:strand:- start:310 stop:489 length:180 start_codon:yes stop_codon:yes gene_type:complete
MNMSVTPNQQKINSQIIKNNINFDSKSVNSRNDAHQNEQSESNIKIPNDVYVQNQVDMF